MNSVPTYGEDQSVPEKFQSSRSRRIIRRLYFLLSIFIVQSTIFVALAGHAMTASSSSYIKPNLPPLTSANTTTISNASTTQRAQVSEPLCPPPDPNSLDPWACDLSRAQKLLAPDKDFGEGRLCRIRPPSHAADQFIKIISPANQCLIISDPQKHVRELCRDGPVFRREQSGQLVLSFCHQYSLLTLTDGLWTYANTSTCRSLLRPILEEIKRKDAQARRLSCEFDSLLARYNCQSGYSVKWSCDECSRIYRSWTCSMVMTFFDEGRPRKPCRSFCQQVERTCPYFHPAHREQYAGEPAFTCIDPQIPFIPSLTPVVPFDDSLECYDECDLEFSQHNCTRSKTAISESQSQIRDCKRRQRERIRLRQRSSTVTSSAASVESYMESAELSVIADDMSDEHELDLSVSNPLRVNDDNSKT